MKKTLRTFCLAAIAVFAIPQQADAQFLKKLKEAATNVVKEAVSGETNSNSGTQGANFVPSASGVSIANPASQSFSIDFVEALGNSADNSVTIVVKATAKDLNYANTRIGDNNVTAYDTDGNEYKSNDSSPAKNLTVGVPVKFEFSKLVNVPATVSMLPVVYTTYYINSDKSSKAGNLGTFIQLKNVPVKWQ